MITPLDMQMFNRLTGREDKALDNMVDGIVAKTSEVMHKTGVMDAARSAVEAARPMVQNVTQALEPAQQIVAGAKTLMSDPLRYLTQAAAKAIPAAIAASASLQYTGGQGSFCNFLYPWVVRCKYLRVDGNRADFIGQPLNKLRPLSVLTGYCKCQNVKLDLPGTSTEPTATIDELQIVVRYLEAGVFLE